MYTYGLQCNAPQVVDFKELSFLCNYRAFKMNVNSPNASVDLTVPEQMTIYLQKVSLSKDKEAFSALFSYYGPRIKSYMLKLGANNGLAEELVQEAMLSVWRKAKLFNSEKSSAGTWIFTIARNLRIDVIRKEKRPEIDANDPTFIPSGDPGPEIQTSIGEQNLIISQALQVLPKDQILVLKKSFFEDKPHSVIASELNIPLGTVKSRLRLAFNRIRALVGEKL